jgi:hypothetical protein
MVASPARPVRINQIESTALRHVVNDRRRVDFHTQHRRWCQRFRRPLLLSLCGYSACSGFEERRALDVHGVSGAFSIAAKASKRKVALIDSPISQA